MQESQAQVEEKMAENKEVLPRWDLSDLFGGVDDPKIESVLDEAVQSAQAFQNRYKGQLSEATAKTLFEAYRSLESLWAPLYKVSQYVSLCYSVELNNDRVKALLSKVDDIESEVANLTLFFELELASYSDLFLDTIVKDPALGPYVYNLLHTHKTSRFNLSEKEEQLCNLKDLSGRDAWKKVYEELTGSFTFTFTVSEDEGPKEMNGSQLRALRMHKDPDVRQRAMKLFYSRYEEHQLVLTHVFNNVVKDYNVERKLRGYPSSIAVKNRANDLDDSVISVLHDVTTRSNVLVQRYYRLKKKLLGLKDMTLADIYAPMPQADHHYSYDEAKGIVLDAFKKFDLEFYDKAKRIFDTNHIDVPVAMSKRGGAFCSSSTPDLDPYVMLNFLNKQRDVSTLAHELGHAIHAMLSTTQPLFNYHAILPLCETASVFCEMLVTDYMKARLESNEEKLMLLTDKLEDIFATSHRQNLFSRFEMAVHQRLSEASLSTTELCDLYRSELSELFGDAVRIPDEYRWEWSTIPHIHESPFYVYSYNFGNLLVLALYQCYLEEGAIFKEKLKNFLSSGSSDSPKVLCEAIGVDISSQAFWEKSLTYIEGLIDECERLI